MSSFLSYPTVGGMVVMGIIFLMFLISMLVFISKFFQLHREEVDVTSLLNGIINTISRNALVEAATLCDSTPGPVARMIGETIAAHKNGSTDIPEVIHESALVEFPKLERSIRLLGVMTYVFPLLGLLGTVLGLIAFFEPNSTNTLNGDNVLTAYVTALYTTFFGLAASIICYIAYNYLVAKVEAITLDFERAACEVVGLLAKHSATKNATETPKQDK